MAQRKGITIRIGAAHDEVVIPGVATFDRAQMRKDGHRHLVDRLNKEVVNAYADAHGLNKDRRRQRFDRKRRDKDARAA